MTVRKAKNILFKILTAIQLLIMSEIVMADDASFPCVKAAAPIEKLICQPWPGVDMRELDRSLSREYKKAIKISNDPEKIKKEQKTWLKTRESCLAKKYEPSRDEALCNAPWETAEGKDRCAKTQCVARLYRHRIRELTGNCYRSAEFSDGVNLFNSIEYPECAAVLENLNHFCNEGPMLCEWKIDPKLSRLATPVWRELDVKKYETVILSMMKNTNQEDFLRVRELINSNQINLSTAEIDLDGKDGEAENVVRIKSKKCSGSDNAYSSLGGPRNYLLLANHELDEVVKDRQGGKRGMFFFGAENLISIDGVNYILNWDRLDGVSTNRGLINSGTLSVYKPGFGQNTKSYYSQKACQFEYLGK